jgi:hypothetical protein
MMKIFYFLFFLISSSSYVFAQFAPAAGTEGSTAIFKDSSVFVAWAQHCEVTRGYQNITDPSLGLASAGDSTMALGKAGSNGVVSLGDGGSAMLTFEYPIYDGPGWDFAVFENGFIDTYLELAFVEVSSDGQSFYRFPSTSLIQDSAQIGGFGSVETTKLDQLAGKYIALYGTPFDLHVLKNEVGLDIQAITHIKIIDVVGNIIEPYVRYDHRQQKINDPWPTPFPSGGFDLDAVGIIHELRPNSTIDENLATTLEIFPNPVSDQTQITFVLSKPTNVKMDLVFSVTGRFKSILPSQKFEEGTHKIPLTSESLHPGVYVLRAFFDDHVISKKIIRTNQ